MGGHKRVNQVKRINTAKFRPLPQLLDDTDSILKRCDMLIDILQRSPEAKDTRMLLVSLLDAAGAHDEALLVMAQGIDYHDRDAEIYVRLGRMLAERGQTEDAFNAFEIALSLAPEAGVLQEALAALLDLTEGQGASTPTGLRAAAAPAGLRFARAAALN